MASSSTSPALDACKSKRHDSFVKFMEEFHGNSLNLEEIKLGIEEVNFLLKFLPHSQVTELRLRTNELKNKMKEFSEILIKTKIRKLNVSECDLTKEDLFNLMKVLKDTKVTELDVYYYYYASDHLKINSEEEEMKFISFLLNSKLRIFNYNFSLFDYDGRGLLLQAFPNTSITKLNISDRLDSNILVSLFSNLHRSSLTDLQLKNIDFDEHLLKTFSQNLGNSKLEKLGLSNNEIDDNAVDVLVKGLIQSKIVDLNLSNNKISGSNTLGLHLKDTCITKLDLSGNKMEQHGIFLSPDFLANSSVTELLVKDCQLSDILCHKLLECLRFSKVNKLNIGSNNLQKTVLSKFARIVKDTDLKEVDFSHNNFNPDALVILGDCIKVSKLSCLDLSYCFKHPDIGAQLSVFLSKIKGSFINSLEDLSGNKPNETSAKALAIHLTNSTLTHLELSYNEIGNGIISIAEHLKFTALVKLYLYDNKITDEGVEALAKHLNETQLIDLNLSLNDITNRGARALARSIKNSNLLKLEVWDCEKIGEDGIKAVIRGAENTFITFLEVCDYDDGMEVNFLLESILWDNKASVQRLVRTFKQISPQTMDGNFRFNENAEHQFLEQCLELYMHLTQKTSAVRVLLEEKSITFSKEEIISLVSGKFPKQFCHFISNCVETDVMKQVKLLKSAEKKGLDRIVKLLLLNRHLYLIDEKKGILHPFVYKLLHKYNYPLYNFDVEPIGRRKIVNYFSENLDIEGASYVINLLGGMQKH